MSNAKAIMDQLLSMPQFTKVIDNMEKNYFEDWVNADTPEYRERLHLKVEILREVVGEIKSLASD